MRTVIYRGNRGTGFGNTGTALLVASIFALGVGLGTYAQYKWKNRRK